MALDSWPVKQSVQVLEWQAEAAKRAEQRAMVEAILIVLRARFGAEVPGEVETRIRGTEERTQLDHWLEAAVTTTSLEEFRQIVNL